MNIFNEFEEIVDKAIQINHEQRKRVPQTAYNDYHWAEEFCSIMIDVGRQVGKSIYAIKLGNKNPETSVIIVRTRRDVQRYKNDGALFDILTPHEVETYNLGQRKVYNTIIFDEPKFFSPPRKQLLPYFVVPGAFQTFISLGMT